MATMQISEMKKFEDHITVPFVAAQSQKLNECPTGKIPQYAANLTMVSEAYRQAMLLFKGIWLTDNPRYAACDIKYVIQHLQSGKRYPNLEIPSPKGFSVNPPQTPPAPQPAPINQTVTPPVVESQPAPQTNQQTPPVQQNAAPQPAKQETSKQGNAPTGANATVAPDLIEEAKRQADASNPVKPDEPQPEPDQQNPAPESTSATEAETQTPPAQNAAPETKSQTQSKPNQQQKQPKSKKYFIAPGVEAPDDWDKMKPHQRCRYIESMHNPQLIGPKVPDEFANMSAEQKINVLKNAVRFGANPTSFHVWQLDAMLAVLSSDAFKGVCVKNGAVNAEKGVIMQTAIGDEDKVKTGVTAMQIKRTESTIGDKDKKKYNFFLAIELESQKDKEYAERDFLQIGIKTVPTYKKDAVDIEWVPFIGRVNFQDDPNKKP